MNATASKVIFLSTHPIRNMSANFNSEALIRIGNGYFSNKRGNLTIASHCSPTLPDLRPEMQQVSKWIA